MKKLLLAPALLSFVIPDLQAHNTAYPCYNTPYVGLGVGALSSRYDVKVKRNIGDPVFEFHDSLRSNKQSIAGEALAGWSMYYYRLYYGIEGYFNFTENKARIKYNRSPVDVGESLIIRTKYAGGVAGRVGYLLNKHSLVYARLGYEARRFRVELDRNAVANDIRKKYTKSAIVPGLGFETDIMPRWTLGGEGRVAYYTNSKKLRAGTSSVKNKARVDTLLLNVKYKFFAPKC